MNWDTKQEKKVFQGQRKTRGLTRGEDKTRGLITRPGITDGIGCIKVPCYVTAILNISFSLKSKGNCPSRGLHRGYTSQHMFVWVKKFDSLSHQMLLNAPQPEWTIIETWVWAFCLQVIANKTSSSVIEDCRFYPKVLLSLTRFEKDKTFGYFFKVYSSP